MSTRIIYDLRAYRSYDLESCYSPFVCYSPVVTFFEERSMAFLESIAHFATTAAAVATILSPAAAMASGVAPRLGPGRAIALALRSRFGAVGTRSSQRDAEVK